MIGARPDAARKPAPTKKPDVATEAIAGVTTFFTMAYIVVVNPSILSTEGTGIAFSGALTATVLLCFTMTLLMGLYARLPFAVAPGMGINGFFTFTLILSRGIPWQVALGMVFWAGVLFLILSVTPVREAIVKAIPPSLRAATAVGIGVFLTFIGLRNAGVIAADPVTLVRLGVIDQRTLLMILGLAVMLWLSARRNPLAFLAGILTVTAVAVTLGMVQVPEQFFERAGLPERVPEARHLGRAAPGPGPRHRLRDVHRSLRLPLHPHRRGPGLGHAGRGRQPGEPEAGPDRGFLRHALRGLSSGRRRARPTSRAPPASTPAAARG